MTNTSKITRFLSLGLAIAGFVLISGSFNESSAQTRDPFEKPAWAKKKDAVTTAPTTKSDKPAKPAVPMVVVVTAPSIEQRIAFYKLMRERAAMNGQEVPKVTSVLTLDELAITGIFRTPRGFAAMVEAKPIKLSFTVYPGEKFFDGQLVAIEENRLTFRKITKMSNNKFLSSVENKVLREYSIQEEVQGTAPVQASRETPPATNPTEAAIIMPPTQTTPIIMPSNIVSPLDEMNKQQSEPKNSAEEKTNKKVKKPTKVAKNKK